MNFEEACATLKKWLEQSCGNPIKLDSSEGKSYFFTSLGAYDEKKIQDFESLYSIKLPPDYRYFLKEIGACLCFNSKVELRPLEEIRDFTAKVFAGLENPFPRPLLVVTIYTTGDEGGFDLQRDSDKQFAIFDGSASQDVDWLDTDITSSWSTFSQWLIALVVSKGQKTLFSA